MECKRCKSSFELIRKNQAYCSKSCQNIAAVLRHRRKNRNPNAKSGPRRSAEIQEMTIAEYCGRRPDKPDYLIKKDSFRFFAKSWNPDLIGLACEECGYDKHTEFCHIKGISEFPPDTKLKVVHARENIKILCPNCHWEFDNLPRKMPM